MIFFAFNGSLDDIHALALQRFGDWYAFPVAANSWIGIIHTKLHHLRRHIDQISPKLLTMPGAHGTLNAAQAQALSGFGLNAAALNGQPFAQTLALAFSASNDPRFDPNAY